MEDAANQANDSLCRCTPMALWYVTAVTDHRALTNSALPNTRTSGARCGTLQLLSVMRIIFCERLRCDRRSFPGASLQYPLFVMVAARMMAIIVSGAHAWLM